MKKPKWQLKFQGLPIIPEAKKWVNGGSHTLEQAITQKLIAGQPIALSEKQILSNLTIFYDELYDKIPTIEFSTFSQKDFKLFQNYIFYAFNYTILLVNELTVFNTFRAVINSSVVGEKKSLSKKRHLSYPPLHIVKQLGKFNRCNSPDKTILYSSESIDTALNELKPKVGELVSVGVWVPDGDRKINSFPISHHPEAHGINENSTAAMNAFLEQQKKLRPELADFLVPFFKILGREFSKPISHHYEYLISALFSSKLFSNQKRENTEFDIECIVYPSVGNKYSTSNLAIRSDVFRSRFKLKQVLEFEVTETNYGKQQDINPFLIKSVGYKNLRETTNFQQNDIIW